MRLIQTSLLNQKAMVFNYMPAILCKYKSGWLIEYYVENPITSEMCRVRRRVHFIRKRYKSVKEAESHCQKIIIDINTKLQNGINPMFGDESAENPIGYTTIPEVVKKFLAEKIREVRPDTVRSYESLCKIFLTYISTTTVLFICKFGKMEAIQYMDYVYNTRKVSTCAYNNYLKFMRLVFNWSLEKGYIVANPFKDIKTKKKGKKIRTPIEPETRKQIVKELSNNDKQFLIVQKLVYSALIRPKEISHLKISDVNFETKTVCVDGGIAKNTNTRHPALTDEILNDLSYIKSYNKEMYIFSTNMLPGYKYVSGRQFTKKWAKLREKLQLDKTKQLYSLRDSGFTELFNANVNAKAVQQHADHHSLEITKIYINHADPNLVKTIRENAPAF